MAKITVAQLPARLYELLAPFTPEERGRAVQATLILFGDEAQSGSAPVKTASRTRGSANSHRDPKAFFDEKAPENKGETLAVAARYRELIEKEESHSKADLKKVITEARRNFDDSNFARDMGNARRQAGFFNLGTGRDASKLSYFGQQFVDALPDREVALGLKKPKVRGLRKRAATAKKRK